MAILKKYIGNNQVGAAKILLEQNSAFRATSTSGSDESLFKLDTENVFRLLKLPRASFDPSHSDDLVRKSYLESSIVDASALLRLEIGAVDSKVDQEILRAQAEEYRLQGEITSEHDRAMQAEAALDLRIDGEIFRATQKESEIEASVATKIPLSYIGAANGVTPLGADSKIPSQFLPAIAITEVYVVSSLSDRNALTVQTGDIAKVTSEGKTYVYDGSQWVELTVDAAVDSVNGQIGNVVLNTSHIMESGDYRYYTPAREQAAKDYADMAVAAEASLRSSADAQIRVDYAAADQVILGQAMAYTDQEVSEEAGFRAAEDLTFLKLDGSRGMMSHLLMGGYRIRNLGAPVDATDAVNAQYVMTADESVLQSAKSYTDSEITSRVTSKFGQPSGLATLDAQGKLSFGQIPAIAITDVYVVQTIAARDALTVEEGDVAKVIQAVLGSDGVTWLPRTYIYAVDNAAPNNAQWLEIETSSDVHSVQGKVGHISLTTSDLPESGDYRYFTPAREQAVKDYGKSYTDSELDKLEIQTQEYREVTISSGILSSGYYDLDVQMVGVPWVMRQGIMGRPGVDFVHTSTRITFTGEWAVGGLTEIALDEKVYVYFMKASKPYLQ